MTKLQRHFVEKALQLLGEATRSNAVCAQKHHNIFGMTLASIGIDGASQDLYDIEHVSMLLWLYTDFDGEK
jgi:hypothetical protein